MIVPKPSTGATSKQRTILSLKNWALQSSSMDATGVLRIDQRSEASLCGDGM
jgi:hypothetical protein